MPAVIPFIPLIAAGVRAGAQVYGAKKQAGSQREAARVTSDAAVEQARIQDEAAQRAERFTREQAQGTWREAETNRRANYDQWVARQRSLNAFRKQYGYGEMGIPDYVASEDPRYGGPDASAPPGGYTGPKEDSWRPMPVRERPTAQPTGTVNDYLGETPDYQPYASAPMGSIDTYLRPRTRRR